MLCARILRRPGILANVLHTGHKSGRFTPSRGEHRDAGKSDFNYRPDHT